MSWPDWESRRHFAFSISIGYREKKYFPWARCISFAKSWGSANSKMANISMSQLGRGYDRLVHQNSDLISPRLVIDFTFQNLSDQIRDPLLNLMLFHVIDDDFSDFGADCIGRINFRLLTNECHL